ncbi:MAG: hypothetical protein ACR2FX_03260 [Chthoniobacterales bacterium]
MTSSAGYLQLYGYSYGGNAGSGTSGANDGNGGNAITTLAGHGLSGAYVYAQSSGGNGANGGDTTSTATGTSDTSAQVYSYAYTQSFGSASALATTTGGSNYRRLQLFVNFVSFVVDSYTRDRRRPLFRVYFTDRRLGSILAIPLPLFTSLI